MSAQQQQTEKKKRVSKKAMDAEMLIDTNEPKKRTNKKKVDTINDTTIQLEQIMKEEISQKEEIEKLVQENMTNPSRDVIGHLANTSRNRIPSSNPISRDRVLPVS